MCSSDLYAQKPVKVKGVQGRWQVSDDITLKQAEERAFMEAKKAALQKAGVMENVWSVFGQITQEDGQELHEAYSQMNVLAIGGMVNVTNKKVEEVWDTDTRSLYKVVTIDAEVRKVKEGSSKPAYGSESGGGIEIHSKTFSGFSRYPRCGEIVCGVWPRVVSVRSEEHTSELQSLV